MFDIKLSKLFKLSLIFLLGYVLNVSPFTLMLDPAGDAQHAGRQIDDCLERGITLQFAEKLKQELENKFDGMKVVFTRLPGEKLEPLEKANFANRLDVDFYLSINFYKETEIRPKMYLFTFSYNGDFITKKPDLYFYPYDKVHLINIDKTNDFSKKMKIALLDDKYKKMFDFEGIVSLPFKPLIGVKAPAVSFELGLIQKNDWINYIDVFSQVIGRLFYE